MSLGSLFSERFVWGGTEAPCQDPSRCTERVTQARPSVTERVTQACHTCEEHSVQVTSRLPGSPPEKPGP